MRTASTIAAIALSAGLAQASSISEPPVMKEANGPSVQEVGTTIPQAAEAVDSVETSSTSDDPVVISAPTLVRTSPSILEMPPEPETERQASSRRSSVPMVIRGGIVSDLVGAPAAPVAAPADAGMPEGDPAMDESWESMDPIEETDEFD